MARLLDGSTRSVTKKKRRSPLARSDRENRQRCLSDHEAATAVRLICARWQKILPGIFPLARSWPAEC
jgi:hypothetical protein